MHQRHQIQLCYYTVQNSLLFKTQRELTIFFVEVGRIFVQRHVNATRKRSFTYHIFLACHPKLHPLNNQNCYPVLNGCLNNRQYQLGFQGICTLLCDIRRTFSGSAWTRWFFLSIKKKSGQLGNLSIYL